MRRPVIFMFSGQGSHYYHMGWGLYESHPTFKTWMKKGERVYQNVTGSSLLDFLYHPEHRKDTSFTNILLTHPAIFMVEYALAQVLQEKGIFPDYVLGASLGEFAAAAIAGVFPFETALELVIIQAQMFEVYCALGGMMAILEPPSFYEKHVLLREKSTLAAINFPSHFIISGAESALQEIEVFLKTQHISYQQLAVNFAFHSPLIDEAAPYYLSFVEQFALSEPKIPLISCAQKGFLSQVSPSHFWHAVRLPIYFQKTLEGLECEGNFTYIDVGPSGTLANFVKYSLPKASPSQAFSILTPFGCERESLEKLVQHLSTI